MMTLQQLQRMILQYEIRSSWWAKRVSNKKLQGLAVCYFAWKVKRKMDNWITNTPK